MLRKIGFLFVVVSAIIAVLVAANLHRRYHFNALKTQSLKAFGGVQSETEDLLLKELAFRRKLVVDAVHSVAYPMDQDPRIIYALPWCESYGCGLDFVWLGTEPVAGVQFVFSSGREVPLFFDNEKLAELELKHGLAKEVSLECFDSSQWINAESLDSIRTVQLLGVNGSAIGRGVEPRRPEKAKVSEKDAMTSEPTTAPD